ncbi:MAG: ABC transporter ATP-binding protein [Lachnospiraceae bacterium]|nr:ABC transporter ATP-binding protein [Lachnospiraceae bacterium]
MKNFIHIFKNNCFMLQYVLKYVPGLVVYNLLFNLFAGCTAVFTDVYIAKYILDAFQYHKSIQEVATFLLLLVGANVLRSILEAYYSEVFYPKRSELLFEKMHSELFQKAKDMELACYDNPAFYNDFVWAMSQADGKALDVMRNFGLFISQSAKIFTVIAIILSIDWFGIVIIAVSFVVSLLIQSYLNKNEYALSLEQNPLQRKRDYISRVMYLSDYAKEIRLSHVTDKLAEDFSRANSELLAAIRKYGRKMLGLQIVDFAGNQAILMKGVYVLYLLFLVLVRRTVSYGGFVGLYQGSMSLNDNLYHMSNILGGFQKLSLYVEKFRVFLSYEPKLKDGTEPIPAPAEEVTLRLDNVTFQYEGTDKPTLHDISLTIHPGEKVALVGYNGAGKSTLVKLLMRLYDVSSGSITMNGTDIRQFSKKDYYNCFGVVFQDFKLFAATIAENVMMDRVGPGEEQQVREALEKSDFTERLAQLPQGISTMLTREFDKKGVNLSGGEAQKVAIARIFPKNSRIVILDEPSSALDPITEYYVNQSMLKAAGDKTILYISHRLSTTKMADRIIMLENGRIIEEGSHEQLMALDGKYAEMFHMQAKKYQEA